MAEEIGGRLRRAADAGQLGDPVRLDVELEAGLDDGAGNRVVAAARAQGRHRAFVVAVGVAELVFWQLRMVELGLCQIGHDITLRSGVILSASRWSPMAPAMKRAVIGVPS